MTRFITVMVSLAALAATISPSWAAGAYDGTWIVDLPASIGPGFGGPDAPCIALRLRILIKDSQLSAELQRSPLEGNVVENSSSPKATPLTGMVRPDGSVVAKWGPYVATGTLAGPNTRVTVQGACGPRSGTAVRIG
jgi:hypothetical protein